MPKISSFADGAPLTATDEFVIARSGTNKKITGSTMQSFVGSSSPLALPNGISPSLWLSASTITGLVNNDPVTLWEDQSTVGNDATAVAAPPTYKTNVWGTHPAVRFDGVNDFMTLTSTLLLGAYSTVLACAELNAAIKGLVMGNSAANIQYAALATDNISMFDTGTTLTSFPFQTPCTSFRMMVWRHSYQQWDFFEGDVRWRTPTTSASGLSTDVDQIGKSNYAGDFLNADVAEIVCFQRDISEGDLDGLFNYFAGFYFGHLFA